MRDLFAVLSIPLRVFFEIWLMSLRDARIYAGCWSCAAYGCEVWWSLLKEYRNVKNWDEFTVLTHNAEQVERAMLPANVLSCAKKLGHNPTCDEALAHYFETEAERFRLKHLFDE
jgi:hypothetical protein